MFLKGAAHENFVEHFLKNCSLLAITEGNVLSGCMKALCVSTRVCSQGGQKPREQGSETPWLRLCGGPRKGWKERVSPVRWFWVTGGYLKEPSTCQGLCPRQLTDWARACLWALISSPLSFLGRLDAGGGPPACGPAAMVRPSPDTDASSPLSHVHPLHICLRVEIPASPLLSPLALSTATYAGIFWWGSRFGVTDMPLLLVSAL